ncbi:PKD domain-containing protein [candidate division KSB1 bacterium]|nr:PKD domain-containing protein [candidate division KSB1 bacterium]
MSKISRASCKLFIVILCFSLLFFMFCSKEPGNPVESTVLQTDMTSIHEKVKQVMTIQTKHNNDLLNLEGVVGVGTGVQEQEAVITVYTIQHGAAKLPKHLDGVKVVEEATGPFVAMTDPTVRFDRPVPTGVSTGHPDITAGTIACRVKDDQGNVYALSNNHVYAASNEASIGDPVLQPGVYDGGQNPADIIGELFDFEPIKFDGTENIIDAAIALTSVENLARATPSDDGYGLPGSTVVQPYIGMNVKKYGRTTGLTHGQVTELNVTLAVCYECGDPMCWLCRKRATFSGQISISGSGFSGGGDSGSLIVTEDVNNSPVALLFAGSSTKTTANPITAVLDRFNVTVDGRLPGENIPPDADFNYLQDQLEVSFTDNSTDADGQVVNWLWDFGDNSSSDLQNPVHTFSDTGTYVVTLTVTDDDGDTDSVVKPVIVTNIPANLNPTADFSFTTTALTAGFVDKSTDSDGSIVTWHWDFGDGGTSHLQHPSHTYTSAGTYNVTLTVTDDDGGETSVTKQVTVTSTPPNNPPTAMFSYYIITGTAVKFTDESTDPDGRIIGWKWEFGDGKSSPSTNPIHIYPSQGTYAVKLTVTDNKGAKADITQDVVIGGADNIAPVADFDYNISDLTVNFTDNSSDEDGTIIGWHWSFGDGMSSPAQNPIHVYSTDGTYSVTLTVTDNDGATDSITQDITIELPANQPPVADFTFTVSGSIIYFTDASYDPDGYVIGWRWDFGDGYTSPAQNPGHYYSAPGEYTVTLTATDNKGLQASTSQLVSIEAPEQTSGSLSTADPDDGTKER